MKVDISDFVLPIAGIAFVMLILIIGIFNLYMGFLASEGNLQNTILLAEDFNSKFIDINTNYYGLTQNYNNVINERNNIQNELNNKQNEVNNKNNTISSLETEKNNIQVQLNEKNVLYSNLLIDFNYLDNNYNLLDNNYNILDNNYNILHYNYNIALYDMNLYKVQGQSIYNKFNTCRNAVITFIDLNDLNNISIIDGNCIPFNEYDYNYLRVA
jgi:hypothetical protein